MTASRAVLDVIVPAAGDLEENSAPQIAPGKEGDLVIFSGHPFEAGSAVKRVIVGGEEVTP